MLIRHQVILAARRPLFCRIGFNQLTIKNDCFHDDAMSCESECGIRVHNSLTKTLVPFTMTNSRRPNTVHWYMCGPTVYDETHMGHASCYVKFDIVRRIMEEFFGLDVVLLLGITDVDDKIVRKAKETQMEFIDLARKYEREFVWDMRALNVKSPTITLRVTESIFEIIAFIADLIDKKIAYVAKDDSVYFDLEKYGPNIYGKFQESSGLQSEDPINPMKKNVTDFALWKSVDPNEPGWPSPWCSNGRPGWHIECSAMTSRVFGDNFQVHSGGVDLQFPHHQNELAQSCARHSHVTPDKWVSYWLHSGHLFMNGVKMSKSIGNVVTVKDFLNRHEADVFRIACLMSHYRKSMDYSESIFDEPQAILRRLRSFISASSAYIQGKSNRNALDEPQIMQRLDECKEEIKRSLANDFDTHSALVVLMDLVAFNNKQLIQDRVDSPVAVSRSPATMALVSQYVLKFTESLGVFLNKNKDTSNIEDGQNDVDLNNALDQMIQFRKEVRDIALNYDKSKDDNLIKNQLLKACDRARNSLSPIGFEIQDRKTGTLWMRTKLKKS